LVGARATIARPASQPASVQVAGWDFVMTVPATTDDSYQVTVPTFADSNATGFHRAVLFVRAATASPGAYYDSSPDSGYSVDNLPPAPPAGFVAAYQAGATHLHWAASSEADLWYYRVYRGSSAGFVPGPSNMIAARSDTGYVDAGAAGAYYKLSAVDVSGNESGFALLTPGGTTDVIGGGAAAFALGEVHPNPGPGDRLSVEFVLPNAAPARLELVDVGGRRVAAREVGTWGPGRHTVDLASGHHVAAGVYLVRLTQGPNARVQRIVVIE
jgi:hypothetical protein